jgi:O-antigen ligase
MIMPGHDHAGNGDRLLFLLSGALLTLSFASGGSSQESGIGATMAQLAAIPILFYAFVHASRHGRLAPVRWPIALVLFIVLIPLLQLLPLSAWLWNLPPARASLQQDLIAAGVTGLDLRWSLAPAATERDLLSLLPAVALFFAAIALGHTAWRWLLWWVIGLAVFSLMLAFAQLGAPQDSFLNPFPQYAPALAGVFANKNHQAGALAIGLVLSVALLVDARRRASQVGDPRHGPVVLFALLALLFALVLPLVNSRAGVIIAMVATGAALLTSGTLSLGRLRASRSMQVASIIALTLSAVGAYSAVAWMHADSAVTGSRAMLSQLTLNLGLANAPLGGGFGSFVPMFQQGTGDAMLVHPYINAAHDEYVQWWFEGGALAILALLATAGMLMLALYRLLRRRAESSVRTIGVAAWMGLLVMLLHSSVDYPLRTPALMGVFALLAGVVFAAAARTHERSVNMPPDQGNSALRALHRDMPQPANSRVR